MAAIYTAPTPGFRWQLRWRCGKRRRHLPQVSRDCPMTPDESVLVQLARMEAP